MARIRTRSEGALYDRIRQDIEANVMSGLWAPGHRIPYEHELMKQYDCSRMTINRALGTLVERGLIERRKRAGTFVMAPGHHRAAFELPSLRSHVRKQGKRYDFRLIDREVRSANASDRSRLDIAGGDVLQIGCVHFAHEKPFALENRIINLDMAPLARSAAFDREPPDAWLFDHVPWSDARHEITAVNADRDVSLRLGIRVDAACLMIERWTWRVFEKITYVQMIHPGTDFTIAARFRP